MRTVNSILISSELSVAWGAHVLSIVLSRCMRALGDPHHVAFRLRIIAISVILSFFVGFYSAFFDFILDVLLLLACSKELTYITVNFDFLVKPPRFALDLFNLGFVVTSKIIWINWHFIIVLLIIIMFLISSNTIRNLPLNEILPQSLVKLASWVALVALLLVLHHLRK